MFKIHKAGVPRANVGWGGEVQRCPPLLKDQPAQCTRVDHSKQTFRVRLEVSPQVPELILTKKDDGSTFTSTFGARITESETGKLPEQGDKVWIDTCAAGYICMVRGANGLSSVNDPDAVREVGYISGWTRAGKKGELISKESGLCRMWNETDVIDEEVSKCLFDPEQEEAEAPSWHGTLVEYKVRRSDSGRPGRAHFIKQYTPPQATAMAQQIKMDSMKMEICGMIMSSFSAACSALGDETTAKVALKFFTNFGEKMEEVEKNMDGHIDPNSGQVIITRPIPELQMSEQVVREGEKKNNRNAIKDGGKQVPEAMETMEEGINPKASSSSSSRGTTNSGGPQQNGTPEVVSSSGSSRVSAAVGSEESKKNEGLKPLAGMTARKSGSNVAPEVSKMGNHKQVAKAGTAANAIKEGDTMDLVTAREMSKKRLGEEGASENGNEPKRVREDEDGFLLHEKKVGMPAASSSRETKSLPRAEDSKGVAGGSVANENAVSKKGGIAPVPIPFIGVDQSKRKQFVDLQKSKRWRTNTNGRWEAGTSPAGSGYISPLPMDAHQYYNGFQENHDNLWRYGHHAKWQNNGAGFNPNAPYEMGNGEYGNNGKGQGYANQMMMQQGFSQMQPMETQMQPGLSQMNFSQMVNQHRGGYEQGLNSEQLFHADRRNAAPPWGGY